MFPFESNIGELKRSFNCVDVVEQIAINYSIKATLDNETADDCENPVIIRPKFQNVTLEQERILEASSLKIQIGLKHKIGYTMRWKKHIFKSTSSIATKSVDYFVELTDGSIGIIEYFIQIDKLYIIVRKYSVLKSYNHLIQVNLYDMLAENNISEVLFPMFHSLKL